MVKLTGGGEGGALALEGGLGVRDGGEEEEEALPEDPGVEGGVVLASWGGGGTGVVNGGENGGGGNGGGGGPGTGSKMTPVECLVLPPLLITAKVQMFSPPPFCDKAAA